MSAIITAGCVSVMLLTAPSAGAGSLASNVPTCKGSRHPETFAWFSEMVRPGDLHASLVANKTYTVGKAYQVKVWSANKWNATLAIIHNFDNDGVCEVRAAKIQ